MPYSVQQLIQDQKLLTVTPGQSMQTALASMLERGYSQLPVVDHAGKPIGLITSEAILEELHNFDVTTRELQVEEIMTKVGRTYEADEDVFELLRDLQDIGPVLIVNRTGQLVGIVTTYDTTQYFRQHAQDLMFVKDIELTLRAYIVTAFSTPDGNLDEAALGVVVNELKAAKQVQRKQMQNALNQYLNMAGGGRSIDKDLFEKVFTQHFGSATESEDPDTADTVDTEEPIPLFAGLTLNDYIQILMHKSRITYFENVLKRKKHAMFKLLSEVRQTRNDLAHFREISPEQRKQLRFCAEWLAQHPPLTIPAAPETAGNKQTQGTPSDPTAVQPVEAESGDNPPLDAMGDPDEGRYAALARYLQNQPSDQSRITLTFTEIENIIGGPLPASARRHLAWWANDSVSHRQSQEWLAAGWRMFGVVLSKETVDFVRNEKQERAYNDFFKDLYAQLKQKAPFAVRTPMGGGSSWYTVAVAPDGTPHVAFWSISFSNKEFRVVLYIDSRDSARNKQVYDALHAQKDAIEGEMGTSLQWLRLDERRPSRIELFRPGAIDAHTEQLAQLQEWGTEQMIRLYQATAERVRDILKTSATG